MVQKHILVQTFPAQGALNPCLQIAKNLARLGARVTFLVSASVQRRMEKKSSALKDLRIVTFSDGYDDGLKMDSKFPYDEFMSQFKTRCSKAISDIINTSIQEGFPITGLVYTMLSTCAAEVAHKFNIPATPLWVQPATILDIYYYYFNGFGDAIEKIVNDPSSHVDLPCIQHLTSQDLPSFMVPSNKIPFNQIPAFKEQLDTLEKEAKPKVLVNSFDELESKALRAIDKYNLIAIGPLVPSSYLHGQDSSDTSFGGDLIKNSTHNYLEWLNTKPEKSVVYVSFGSFLRLPERQMEEIARGLLESGRPFLWVIRVEDDGEREEDKLSCKKELGKQGMIVSWCSQVEVLSHPSIGCFVTHCGWNSSLESLVFGVPIVGLPQLIDQPTNAKLLQDEFKTGVRGKANVEGVIEGEEIMRCIDLVLGSDDVGEEMREHAKKWKYLAKEATKIGGSSYNNLKAFVEEEVE